MCGVALIDTTGGVNMQDHISLSIYVREIVSTYLSAGLRVPAVSR